VTPAGADHHLNDLLLGDVRVGQRDGRLEAHELAHRMAAGDEVVEQVVLLRAFLLASAVQRLPQRAAVAVFDFEIVLVALVHPADRAEHWQRLFRPPIDEG